MAKRWDIHTSWWNLSSKKVVSLGKQFESLREENQNLRSSIESLEQKKSELEKQLILWRERYDTLKVANSILGSNENKTEAKLKINALIREIDACIVQLSE
ncbi:conserved hypothetical protein [Capnocytophaga canimorsus]|uniref:Uncharacterized protein n=1 Tax=Capnocytophaga canimorsus TaxID=28188 RepID=A0A0B7IC58_9FLAO|nr:hypothetical protein [Capnocytophaga canimorsus]CEN49516.1 conserved hypothetical protein [Capnocytophaga canimorsus]